MTKYLPKTSELWKCANVYAEKFISVGVCIYRIAKMGEMYA